MSLQHLRLQALSIVTGLLGPRRPRSVNRGMARRLKLVCPTDTMIASYPRSGNTWLRFLLCDVLLQQRGMKTDTTLPVHPDRLIPDLDRGDRLPAEHFSAETSRCIKTHLGWNDAFRRAVVVFRQPADSLCSYYHFCVLCPQTRHLTADGIDAFCLAQLDDWSGHLRSYLAASQAKECRVLFLTYEQMKRFPSEALGAACDFVGLDVNQGHILRAVSNHVFERHTSQEKACSQTGEKFFRRGEIGSADDELQPSTRRTIRNRTASLVAAAEEACPMRPQRRMAG